jgi:hypothetical protein
LTEQDEDLIEVVWVTHPGRKSDTSWSLEEKVTKQESANDLEEELEAGTKETQEGPDQTSNFLMDDGEPTPIMPKDPPLILKVSKP